MLFARELSDVPRPAWKWQGARIPQKHRLWQYESIEGQVGPSLPIAPYRPCPSEGTSCGSGRPCISMFEDVALHGYGSQEGLLMGAMQSGLQCMICILLFLLATTTTTAATTRPLPLSLPFPTATTKSPSALALPSSNHHLYQQPLPTHHHPLWICADRAAGEPFGSES